jgi:hypothetical protein
LVYISLFIQGKCWIYYLRTGHNNFVH